MTGVDDEYFFEAGSATYMISNPFGVLSNDTDAQGNSISAIQDSGSTSAYGNYDIDSDGEFQYAPPGSEFRGVDSFSYQVQDANGDPTGATVSITVNDVEDLDPALGPQDEDIVGSGFLPYATVSRDVNYETDTYRFTVDESGAVVIDIDGAAKLDSEGGYASGNFESYISLYQVIGGRKVYLYDGQNSGTDAGSDSTDYSGYNYSPDAYLAVVLQKGTYYVDVTNPYDSGSAEGEFTYTLNVTVPKGGIDHEISEDPNSVTQPRVLSGNILPNDPDLARDDYVDNGGSPIVAEGAGQFAIVSVDGSVDNVGEVIEGKYGRLKLNQDGSYSYKVFNTNALIAGETGTDTFTYRVEDWDNEYSGTRNGAAPAEDPVETVEGKLTFKVIGADLDIDASGAFIAHRGHDIVRGSAGSDQFAGRTGNDKLFGFGGDDTLWGEDGADELSAGAGNDRAIGGSGADKIWLGSGNDKGWGGAGDDTIYGGSGRDTLIGNSGDDVLFGQSGRDELFGSDGDDQLVLGGGDDTGWGAAGNDTIWGDGGNDRLIGGAGRDTLIGGDDNDKLWGDSGNDRLFGGKGADQLVGGTGDDRLYLDAGNDTAWGGDGADQFIFTQGFGSDRVKDFGEGDNIVFDGDFTSLSEVKAHMTTDGDNVVIDLPGAGNKVIVEHVDSLSNNDFLFV